MKLTPWFLAAIAPIAAAGCSGTLFGHVAVLAVTLGIFIGTLSLGRVASAASPLPAQTTSELAVETTGDVGALEMAGLEMLDMTALEIPVVDDAI